MPFKSEKQRKYLWANEPEIARDWTDTYGSKIHKADGGRIGFQAGTPPGVTGRTGGGYSDRERGQQQARTSHHPRADTSGYTPTHVRSGIAPPKQPERDGIIQGIKNFPDTMNRRGLRRNLDYYMGGKKLDWPLLAGIFKGPQEKENYYTEFAGLSPIEMQQRYEGTLSQADMDRVQHMSSVLGQDKINRKDFEEAFYGPKGPPQPDTGGGGEGGQVPWWLRQQAPVASIDDTATASTGLGEGHFQVPIDLVVNQTRAADGGIIGSVGGISRPKYQEGNMVGAEMEGAEMEGAMMQSKEVIKELYDALIAQGLSPQEAMEKIKEMIAASGAERPQSPMMGEEFPGQEFGGGPRAPAAFGGIMDTYTGRRKYGLGSSLKKLVSKGVSKLKKLASSKLGKLALMYAAGTYLGGMEAFGGTGYSGGAPWTKFGKQLLNPLGESGIANLAKPGGWSMFQSAPAAGNYGYATEAGHLASGAAGGARLPGASSNIFSKVAPNVAKSDWSKWILPASIGAGAYTALAPVPELDDTQGEWDKKKEEFDAYLASLDTGDSYRVPENLRLAQGGRIGRQEGGLMNLGGMEKDYRNDGGFVPLGGEEKADDVPARLSRNEFVFTADAVKNAGGGDIDKGAEVMENVMKNLEGGGQISEESQGQGAQEMFEVSERLSEVI